MRVTEGEIRGRSAGETGPAFSLRSNAGYEHLNLRTPA